MIAYVFAAIIIAYTLVTTALFLLSPAEQSQEDLERERHAVVVVMGDLGHSPRMNFHALSIAKCGWKVSLVGYVESELMAAVTEDPLISVIKLPTPSPRSGNFLIWAVKRVLDQHYRLWKTLKSLDKASKIDVLLVQNPPSIPTLGVARIFVLFARPGTKMIIDWHNLGYTILAMKAGKFAVWAYRAYEVLFGRIAYLHLCVSVRLGMALRSGMGINAKRIMPIFDRPFKSYALELDQVYAHRRKWFPQYISNSADKWLITSTSYTPDEDLDMLLEALDLYNSSPDKKYTLNVIITGKGPLKEQFLKKVSESTWENITLHTAWLSYEQYHQLLSVCDVGISLHKSSSGWDLPMKAIDMFGAGLPVLSLAFPALDELVHDRKNGLVFRNARGLSDRLLEVFGNHKLFETIKAGALEESSNTWEEQWHEKLGPVFGQGMYTGIEESSSSDED